VSEDEAVSSAEKGDSLSNRALLTFTSQVLAQAAGLVAGLVFTPLIIRGLQAEMYGIWSMIQKATGFIGFTNLNAMGIIKLQLGVRQHSSDVSEKRRLIGASIVQWFILLPFMVCIVGALGYFAPRVIPTTADYESSIRWTMIIMGASVPLQQLLSLPGGVLAGQNLNYKAMGLNAFMVLFGSSINVAGVLLGYGIVTLAVTTIIGIFLSSAVQFYVVKRAVAWFGVEKPGRRELIDSIKLSLLGSLTTVSGMLLTAADIVVLGMVFGPASAAVYATTGALIRFAMTPVQQLLGSGNSGIGYLAGKKDWDKIAKLRIELHQIALMCLTAIGVVTIIFNESFLHLWIGQNFFGGVWLTLSLVVLALLRQLVNMDAIPLDAVLQLKPKLMVMSFFGVMSLPLGYFLSKFIGLAGYPSALIVSYLGILFCFQFLLRKYDNILIFPHCKAIFRASILSLVLFVVALLLEHSAVFAHLNWFGLICQAGIVGAGTGLAFLLLGVTQEVRTTVIARGKRFLLKVMPV
jgi:O-antigen/teichoic acid export membrane protein